MTIETVLLILESVLLAVTIILLLYSIREGRDRRNLLLEVGKATKILTRQEYFLTVTDSRMDAQVKKKLQKRAIESLLKVLLQSLKIISPDAGAKAQFMKNMLKR
jgi:hypothetical protein